MNLAEVIKKRIEERRREFALLLQPKKEKKKVIPLEKDNYNLNELSFGGVKIKA